MQSIQGDHCPLLNKKCIQNKCKFWVQLRGKNPQTGSDIDEWDCAVYWLPILLIESTQQTRQTGAAIESFRNEMVKMNNIPLIERERYAGS